MSSRTRFARAPTSIRGGSSPYARAGPADIRASSVGRDRSPGSTRCVLSDGEGGLEPGDAERRLLERNFLLVPCVGCVVGRDGRDCAVPHRIEQGLPVLRGPQGRVHLQVRVERRDRLVGQDEVVRRRLAGRLHARRERLPQLVDRLARRQVEQVDRLPLVRGEREVASDHHALGHRRVTGEPERSRDLTLVHLTAAGERRLFAVDGDPPSGDPVVLKSAPHQPRRRRPGRPSSENPAAPASASSAISVSSSPSWPFVIAARKPT